MENDKATPKTPENNNTEQQWDFYNQVNATEPDHKEHTKTSHQISMRKQQLKKKTKRRAQKLSRKHNR